MKMKMKMKMTSYHLNLLFHAGGQADCSNVGSHGDRALEGEHADVVVDVPAVVVLVQANVGHCERLLVQSNLKVELKGKVVEYFYWWINYFFEI